ncbi:MAG: energy transducer TonB [Runella sp.]
MNQYLALFILLCGVSTSKVLATLQQPDVLINGVDTAYIFNTSSPLRQYLRTEAVRAAMFGNKPGCVMTSCWDGFYAVWRIIDNQLYLTQVLSCCFYEDSIKADLKALFGNSVKNGMVKADWLSGYIVVSHGQRLFYASTVAEYVVYAKQTKITFQHGKCIATQTYDNSKSKTSALTHDSRKLQDFLCQQINWDDLPLPEQTIKVGVYVIFKEGVIDSVRVVKSYDAIFDKEAIRVIKNIPEWEVVYRMGEPLRTAWHFPVIFSKEQREKYKKW